MVFLQSKVPRTAMDTAAMVHHPSQPPCPRHRTRVLPTASMSHPPCLQRAAITSMSHPMAHQRVATMATACHLPRPAHLFPPRAQAMDTAMITMTSPRQPLHAKTVMADHAIAARDTLKLFSAAMWVMAAHQSRTTARSRLPSRRHLRFLQALLSVPRPH